MQVLDIDPNVPPSGPGCVECAESGGWWFHLRRCTACGHIGCCDSSPSRHATAHFHATGHPIMRSYEPDEAWFFDYRSGQTFDGPPIEPPLSHPADQPVPGPVGSVPADWIDLVSS
ncbi:MAG: UBP-type zinc finger domain-containing protein [Nostocoides sp.]